MQMPNVIKLKHTWGQILALASQDCGNINGFAKITFSKKAVLIFQTKCSQRSVACHIECRFENTFRFWPNLLPPRILQLGKRKQDRRGIELPCHASVAFIAAECDCANRLPRLRNLRSRHETERESGLFYFLRQQRRKLGMEFANRLQGRMVKWRAELASKAREHYRILILMRPEAHRV